MLEFRSRVARSVLALALAAVALVIPTATGAGADPADAAPGPGRAVARAVSTSLSFDSRGHSCTIDDQAQLRCWGSGSEWELGQPSNNNIGGAANNMGDNLHPVDLGTGRTATAVSAGWLHTCALLDNGTVKCWGNGGSGRLGQGSTDTIGDSTAERGDGLPTVDLGTGRTATAIAAGQQYTCALLDDGTVKCWGNNSSGQLGQGNTDDIGDNPGEMGDNLPAVDLGTGRTATAISAGSSHTCALLDDGTVKCWGSGSFGRLGYGDLTKRGDGAGEMGDNLPPLELGTGRTATAVSAGNTHTCALLDDGTVKCWGGGFNGQLGTGDVTGLGDNPGEMGDNLPPVDLGSGRTAIAIAAGSRASCAVLDDGGVKCWGYGFSGRLGQGDTTDRGDEPGEMGDNLPPIDLPAVAGAWIACHSGKPVGYWLAEQDGTAYEFGDAAAYNAVLPPTGDTVDIEATPTGCGFWMVLDTGVVAGTGDATDLGNFDLSSLAAGEKLSSISSTPTGQGLWGFTDRGRVLTLGDAKPKFAGAISDLTTINLAGPIIDSIPTPSGEGYYMLGSDGGVFAFGDATFAGSLPGLGVTPNQPTVGLVPDPDGNGYWMVAGDGGVFAFGAPFVGSLPGLGVTQLQAPIIGMTPYADGYLQVGSDGGVFNFSSQPFSGSLGDNPPDTPIVGLTPVWTD